MEDWRNIHAKIIGVFGIGITFEHNEKWTMSLPKKFVAKYGMKEGSQAHLIESYSFVCVDSDKGVLLLPARRGGNSKGLKDAINFVDVSYLSDQDLQILSEEE